MNRIAYAFLLLVGVFLAVRTWMSVQSVLSAKEEMTRHEPGREQGRSPLLVAITHKDSLLAGSFGPSGRDPFHNPPPPSHVGPIRRPPPAPLVAPILKALIFDRISPTCVLSYEGDPSGWLRVGESFHGWTVLEIGPGSVTISSNGEKKILSSS